MSNSEGAFATRWLVAIAAALIGAAVMATTPGSASAQQAGTLEGAIEAYVESQGETYAGPCSEADVEEDVGQWCSEVRSQDGNTAEVALGPTFSEFVETVTFEQVEGTWYAGGPDFSPPHSPSATTFDTFVRVSWERGENNQFYCIDTAFRSADLRNISGSWHNWGCGTTETSFDLTNLACDRIHYYRIWAAGPGDSGYSEFGTFRSQECNFTPPTNPRADVHSGSSATLAWDAGNENHWFCADLARNRGDLVNLTGTWFNTGCGTTTPAIDVSGLSCDTTYFWRGWAAGPDSAGYTPIAVLETPPCQFGTQPVTITGGSAGQGPVILTDVRIGAHPAEGFDRIVFQFTNGLPSETTVQYEDSAVQCGSGFTQPLEGAGTLTVRMTSSQAHNEQGQPTVDATELDGTSGAILEAIQICDFEGIVEWAIGTDEVAGFEVTSLRNPDRIVVDIRR